MHTIRPANDLSVLFKVVALLNSVKRDRKTLNRIMVYLWDRYIEHPSKT